MSFRSFQLKSGEELRPGLIRIAARIVKKSASLPGFRPGKAEDAVHEARLLVKLLRTLVWTARPALGRDVIHRIRPQLRAAARCLADLRDATVLASTLSKLGEKVSDPRKRAGYALVAKALARYLGAPGDASVRRKLVAVGHHLERTVLIFRRGAKKTARRWPTSVKRQREAVRSCRKSMKRAFSTGRADDFHEWRKKAKRLLLQWRMVETDPDQPTRKAIDLADQLQAKLGDHHDLVVLEEHLEKKSLLRDEPDTARHVLRQIARKKAGLESRLRPLGGRCLRACAARLKI